MKEKLWRAIEAYRMAGGREEHWRNRDALDQIIEQMVTEIDDLKYELSVAREAQQCECSTDDACRFARERDALKAELAALTQQSFDLCPQCGWRTFIPSDGCLNCLTEHEKEKTE